jgi:uncharacterized protein YegL
VNERLQSVLQVLPFYIVCDESSSMAGAAVDAMNDGMVELFDTFNEDPIIDAKVRVGIVAFNDTARLLFPLTQLSQVTQIPVCVASEREANYGNVFRLLDFLLHRDVRGLMKNSNVQNPLIFFMTAGRPADIGWITARSKFLASCARLRPNIVSFGVAGAEKSVIAEVAHWGSRTGTKFFFMAENDVSPGAAIKEIIKFTVSDMYDSGPSNQAAFQITDGAVSVIDLL